jgi:hypothetical protein
MHFHSNRSEHPLGTRSRWLLAVWCLFLLSGFAVALWLDPDPRGYGTHQRLGLPPCTFRVLYHLPCPSCGMTTSFSHFIRGQFTASARSNAAGLLLASICAVQIPWCLWSAVRGRLWRVSRPDVSVLWLLMVLCGVALLQWGFRLLLG